MKKFDVLLIIVFPYRTGFDRDISSICVELFSYRISTSCQLNICIAICIYNYYHFFICVKCITIDIANLDIYVKKKHLKM